MSAQFTLFGIVPQPKRSREGAKVYGAVMVLRRRGFKVFRVGRAQHRIVGWRGGQTIDTKYLLKFAAKWSHQ